MKTKHLLAGAALLVSLGFATPALAVTSTRVVITEQQDEVPASRIQIFNADTGAEVKPQDDDNRKGALYLLDGGKYRVVVDGRDVREIAVSGTGSKIFNIGLPPHDISVPEPASGPVTPGAAERLGGLLFSVGWGRTEVPQTSAGVVRTDAGEEIPAGLGPRHLNSVVFGAGFDFHAGNLPVFIEGTYSEGNGRSVPFDVPPGSADASGFAFSRETDGSTGIILGNFGGVAGAVSADFNEFGVRLGTRIPLSADNANGQFSISPFVAFDRRRTRFNSMIAITTDIPGFDPDIGQERHDRVTDSWIGLGVRPQYVIWVTPHLGLHFDVAAEVGVFRSSLDSVERNHCDLCGPDLENFTIETKEHDSSVRVRGEAGAGLDFQVSDRTRFGIFAKARFFDSGFSIHPVTGDQVLNGETTRGATDSTFGLTAGVQMESWW